MANADAANPTRVVKIISKDTFEIDAKANFAGFKE